mgnify:CR=1 FL=1|tara:strand:+ start:152 stop:484 length:333 start_codon:yes stop_codon:yes gene_type:complete
MAFKMKGSPMLRNFGVQSPLREDVVVADTRISADKNLVAAASTGNVAVPEIDYKVETKAIDFGDGGKDKDDDKKETHKDRNPSFDKKEQRRMNRENRKKAKAYKKSQKKR